MNILSYQGPEKLLQNIQYPFVIEKIECVKLRQSDKELRWGAVCKDKPFYIEMSARVKLLSEMSLDEIVAVVAGRVFIKSIVVGQDRISLNFEANKVVPENNRDLNPGFFSKRINFTFQCSQSNPASEVYSVSFLHQNNTYEILKDIIFVENEKLRDLVECCVLPLTPHNSSPNWLDEYKVLNEIPTQYISEVIKPYQKIIKRLEVECKKREEVIKKTENERDSFRTTSKTLEKECKKYKEISVEIIDLKTLIDGQGKLESEIANLKQNIQELAGVGKLSEQSISQEVIGVPPSQTPQVIITPVKINQESRKPHKKRHKSSDKKVSTVKAQGRHKHLPTSKKQKTGKESLSKESPASTTPKQPTSQGDTPFQVPQVTITPVQLVNQELGDKSHTQTPPIVQSKSPLKMSLSTLLNG